MTNPEFNTNPESINPTEKLINRLKDILDEYGAYGSDIGADPGVTRKTGFFVDSFPSQLRVITEYVDPNDLGGELVYRIDWAGQLFTNNSYFIDKQTDPKSASSTLEHVIPNLTKESWNKYTDPENAELIDWLLNKKDAEMETRHASRNIPPTKNEERKERREERRRYREMVDIIKTETTERNS